MGQVVFGKDTNPVVYGDSLEDKINDNLDALSSEIKNFIKPNIASHMYEGEFKGNNLAVVCQMATGTFSKQYSYEVVTGFKTMEEAQAWSDSHKGRYCHHVLADLTEL